MGIKVRNLDEIVVKLQGQGGALAADANLDGFVVPFACKLKAIFARVLAAGTTGTMIVDVNKNGTTIFSGAAKLTWASASVSPTYAAYTTDPADFVEGDRIGLDIDSVHTTPAEGLIVELVLSRSKRSSAGTQNDSFGTDNN